MNHQRFWNSIDSVRLDDGYSVRCNLCINFDSNRTDFCYTVGKIYYPNGKIKSEYTDEFDGGSHLEGYPNIEYAANGRIDTFFQTKNGHRVGIYVECYDDGKRKTLGRYILPEKGLEPYTITRTWDVYDSTTGFTKQCMITSNRYRNLKHGRWYYWDEQGKLRKCELWHKGKLQKEIEPSLISSSFN